MGARFAGNRMQALKLKGNIDGSGKLQVSETIDLAPGEVEIIILKADELAQKSKQEEVALLDSRQASENVESFLNWFTAGIPSTSSDVDADNAKWERLKEKNMGESEDR